MKNIRDAKNLSGKKVLLRSDLNVPIKNNKIINDFRLAKARDTIDFLKESGAKIILIGHIGKNGSASLSLVYEYLKNCFPVSFTQEVLGDKTESFVENMKDG